MSAHQNPPKRPRLSLQIKAISNGQNNLRASRTIAAIVNPTSPTAFNTLSNVYSTAIDRVTPVTAIDTRDSLNIETRNFGQQHGSHKPYAMSYPDTPLTAQPLSPAVAMEMSFPSTMTATPPLSAGPIDLNDAKPFTFSAQDIPTVTSTSSSPQTVRRRDTFPLVCSGSTTPYMRNRSLHSILRNSPLPPATARTPVSPRRQSLRLQEKAARRVGYESPLESVIVTNEYTRSHIDLLAEDTSPATSLTSESHPELVLDMTMAYTADETRDGGQTPGPFEEMRRRMAGLVARTPVSPSGAVRKRKKKDRGRRWKWTIGKEEEESDEDVGGAIAAIRAASRANSDNVSALVSTPSSTITPSGLAVVVESPMEEVLTPSIETFQESIDVTMSETCSVVSEPTNDRAWSFTPGADIDMNTPTVSRKSMPADAGSVLALQAWRSVRQDSADMFNPETGSRRDTPVPADMMMAT